MLQLADLFGDAEQDRKFTGAQDTRDRSATLLANHADKEQAGDGGKNAKHAAPGPIVDEYNHEVGDNLEHQGRQHYAADDAGRRARRGIERCDEHGTHIGAATGCRSAHADDALRGGASKYLRKRCTAGLFVEEQTGADEREHAAPNGNSVQRSRCDDGGNGIGEGDPGKDQAKPKGGRGIAAK
ncbi:MAG: hypothetical protein NVS4B8_11770 [Herpetosiphon sp.]